LTNAQFVLLLLLQRLKELGFETQRLKLQKLAYLLDIFGSLISEKPTSYIFTAYKYGPFTKQIFGNIEKLVCIDFVHVKEMGSFWDPETDRSFDYSIEPTSFAKIRGMKTLNQYKNINKCVEFAVQAAGSLNGEEIKRLVYCEPNFLSAKRLQFGSIIDPLYPYACRFKLIAQENSKKFGIKLSDDEVVWLYINFLRNTESSGKDPLAILSTGDL
jgi:uncharacterized protein YwgA